MGFAATHGYAAYKKFREYKRLQQIEEIFDRRHTDIMSNLKWQYRIPDPDRFKLKPVTYTKQDIHRLRSGIQNRVGKGSGRMAKFQDKVAIAGRKIKGTRIGRGLTKVAKGGTKVLKTVGKAAPIIGPAMVLATHYDKPPVHIHPGFDETIRGQNFDYKKAMMEIKPAMVALEIAITVATIALGMAGIAGAIIGILVSVLEISMYAAEATIEANSDIDWTNPIDYITLAEKAYARDKYEKWKADVQAGKDSEYSMQAQQWYHFQQSFDQEGFEELKAKVTEGELSQADLDILEDLSFATPGEALDIALKLDDKTFERLAPYIQSQFHYQQQMAGYNPDNYKFTDAEFAQLMKDLKGQSGPAANMPGIQKLTEAQNTELIKELTRYHEGEIQFDELSSSAQQIVKDNMQKKNKTNTVKPGEVRIGSYEVYLNQEEADIYNAWLRGDMEPLKNASPETQEKFRKFGVTTEAVIIDQASSTDAMAMAKNFEQLSVDYEEMGLDRFERRTGRDYSELETPAEVFLDYLEDRKNSVSTADSIRITKEKLNQEGFKFPADMTDEEIRKIAGKADALMMNQGTAYGDYDYNWDEMYNKLADLDDLWDTRMQDFQEYRRQQVLFTADYERSGKAAFGGGTDYNVEYTRAGLSSLAGGNPTGAQISRKRARFN